jgi:hypothetical protein
VAYEELSGDEDDDTAIVHGRLGIEGRDLVLDLGERERLYYV